MDLWFLNGTVTVSQLCLDVVEVAEGGGYLEGDVENWCCKDGEVEKFMSRGDGERMLAT